MLGKQCQYVLGVDDSSWAIDFAKKNYYQPGKIEFLQADITNLALSQRFDLIISVHTFEHIAGEKVSLLFKNINQWLKPAGRFYLSVPTEASLVNRYQRLMEQLKKIPPWDPTHISFFTVSGLKKMGKRAGLKLLAIHRKLFPSKKLRAIAEKFSLPSFLQNPLTVEAIFVFEKEPYQSR